MAGIVVSIPFSSPSSSFLGLVGPTELVSIPLHKYTLATNIVLCRDKTLPSVLVTIELTFDTSFS